MTMSFPCLIVALALPADVPGANNSDGLSCRVSGSQVSVEWNIAFFREIHSFLVARDGELIASLDPAATSYLDSAAPPGGHIYTLFAMSLDGTAGVVGSCQVTVGEGGLRCHVDGRKVRLEWAPLAITVVIHSFQVLRDGVIETSLPPDRFFYETSLTSAGSFLFEVRAVVTNDPASPTLPVGACRVEAPCFGMSAEVSRGGGLQVPLEVRLSWQPPLAGVPVGDDIAPYLVLRDGEVLVRTSKTEHTDTVPAGRYLYEVWFDHPLLEMPTFLVGSCLVDVGDVGVPAPEDLACQVLHVAPGPDAGGINVPPDLAAVLLTWRNPIVYDKVVITRNDMVIATLPGGETRYTDRVAGAGVFDYAVWGVKGNDRSAAARCTVEVGLDEVPPPQQLSCTLAGLNTDENRDAAGNVIDPAVGGIPSTAVVLRWWSPIRYGSVAVFRDGQLLAQLPGDALVYRDVAPPSGQHLYSVVGVLSDGRSSPAAECTVTVGEVVPPVEDLICGVQEKVNPDTVDLAWTNGALYDAVLVYRDGSEIARLPGDATAYRDSGLAPGVYRYDVVGAVGDRRSPRASCQVFIEGPPRLNVLYFQSPDATLNAAGLAASASNRLVCLLDSAVEVQGWSFGVRSDPRFVVPVSHTLDGTVTAGLQGGAGPAFLSVKLAPEGVTMAVLIDKEAPFEVLPAGRGQALLGIEYGAGPDGRQGELYPVQYSGALGSPPVQVLLVVNGFEVRPATLAGVVTVPGFPYLRADPNGDGLADISDAVYLLNWLFLGGEVPGCMESGDTNGSREINIADPVYLLSSLYNGGPPPPRPYPECGVAPAPLGCKDAGSCK